MDKKVNNLFEEYNTSEQGLTSTEAKERLEKNGLNTLPRKKKDSILKIFFSEFKDPIVIILLIASFILIP